MVSSLLRSLRRIAFLIVFFSGKTFSRAKHADVAGSIETIRYFAGWADKVMGKVMETSEKKLTYTRHEPVGVCVCRTFSYNVYKTYNVQLLGSNHSMELPSYDPISFLLSLVYLTCDLLVLMMAWKIGPALATGNTIVLKPSGECVLQPWLIPVNLTHAMSRIHAPHCSPHVFPHQGGWFPAWSRQRHSRVRTHGRCCYYCSYGDRQGCVYCGFFPVLFVL
jgi:hypothetical protein